MSLAFLVTTLPILKDVTDHLQRFLEEADKYFEPASLRTAFIYRHARNIWDIATEIHFLVSANRTTAVFLLARPALESLFSLIAAVKDPSFAAHRILYEADENIRRIAKWKSLIKDGDDSILSDTIQLVRTKRDEIANEQGITAVRQLNTFETARIAELGDQYLRDYYMFSRHAHSYIDGIIAQEHAADFEIILDQISFIGAAALGHAPQVLKTKRPQSYIDESTKILNRLLKIADQREYQRKKG